MRIDATKSIYHEEEVAVDEFDIAELKHLRFLLRRLRFLEGQVAKAAEDTGGGVIFAETEIKALEYTLHEIGYLDIRDTPPN